MNIKVICHDGEVYETDVSDYNAREIVKTLNDDKNNVIAIGDLILHRTNVSRVVPVKE